MPAFPTAVSAETEVAFTAARSLRLIAARAAGALLTAFTVGFWLGPVFPIVWLIALTVFETTSGPLLNRMARNLDAPTRDTFVRPWFIVGGSMLYLAPCIAAWLQGGESFGPIGAFYIACMLVHGAMFRSSTTLFAIAALGPPSIAAMALPIITDSSPIIMIVTALGGAQLAGVVFMSLAERRRLIERSVEYKTEALDAERANLAKSQFLAVMSHELRTPLNAIIGYAELLEEELADGGAGQPEDARRIAGAGRTLLAMINDILDLSRIEAGRIELNMAPTDMREIVRSSVDLCQPLADKNSNRIHIEIAEGTVFADADAFRLRQCVVNLLSNACKFTSNGDITVSTQWHDGVDGEAMEIRVADTGIGISDEQMSRLFQPFVQADASTTRAFGGTGLGLSITKRLCELMGGSVRLQSAPGHGVLAIITMKCAPTVLAAA